MRLYSHTGRLEQGRPILFKAQARAFAKRFPQKNKASCLGSSTTSSQKSAKLKGQPTSLSSLSADTSRFTWRRLMTFSNLRRSISNSAKTIEEASTWRAQLKRKSSQLNRPCEYSAQAQLTGARARPPLMRRAPGRTAYSRCW